MDRKKVIKKLVSSGIDIWKVLGLFGDNNLLDFAHNVHCPMHEDHTPSMKVNENNTVYCFTCGLLLDMVQLFAFYMTKDKDLAVSIWENEEIKDVLNNLIETFQLDIELEGEEFKDIETEFDNQLAEMNSLRVMDTYYLRNPQHCDRLFTPIFLEKSKVYIFRDMKSKKISAIKVRYEKVIKPDQEIKLYIQKDKKFVEAAIASHDNPIKRKTFRFFNVEDGKIIGNKLPDDKKNLIYNVESIRQHKKFYQDGSQNFIFIVEGEKDVDTMTRYGFTAISLVKGSSSKWLQEYNNEIKDQFIIIATDNDDAGRKYESTLFDELGAAYYSEWDESGENETRIPYASGLKRFNRKFFDFYNMNEKSDITDMIEKWELEGITRKEIIDRIKEIVERSIDYRDTNTLKIMHDGYYFEKKGLLNRITDFHIVNAINIISMDMEQTDMIEITVKGKSIKSSVCRKKVINIHDVFGSPDNFNKVFTALDVTFLGAKYELFLLKDFVLKYVSFEKKYLYSSNGMFEHEGEWLLVSPDGSLRKDGSFDKTIFSSNNILFSDVECVVIPDKEKINEVAPALLNFNVPEITVNVLGEIGCKLLNARYKKLRIKNHLFSLNGIQGAGKTETSCKVMATMMNSNVSGEHNISGQSNFTFLKNVSSSNTGGLILQELKLSKMKDYDRNKWSEIFRNNYDRAKAQRGTTTQGLNEYDHNSPLIITGEEGIGEEAALFERFNLVFMTKEIRLKNSEFTPNFLKLCDNQPVLKGIGKQVIIEILNKTDDDIISERQEIESSIREEGLHLLGFVDRILNNTINVIQGFYLVANTLKKLGYENEIDKEAAFKAIIENFKDNVLRLHDDNITGDDFKRMLVLYQQALDNKYYDRVVHSSENAYIAETESLWISPSKIRTIVANFAQESKIDAIVLSENEFRKNLVKAGYISSSDKYKKKFNKENAKGWYYRVNVSKFKELNLSFVEDFTGDESFKFSIDDNIFF